MLDHHDLRVLLPHGHPFVLVDRVLEVEPGRSLVATKAITGTEPCFRDVPAGAPAAHYRYPAPLLLESLGQAAALLWLLDAGPVGEDFLLMFGAARGYRVLGGVFPGDVVRHEVRLEAVKADTIFAAGVTFVGDRPVAVADSLIAVQRPATVLATPGSVPEHTRR